MERLRLVRPLAERPRLGRLPVARLPLDRRALVPLLDPLLELRVDFRPDAVLRPLLRELRPEPLVPFRREACEFPRARARARAVSRPTSLLKLLRWPPAVFS